MAIRITDKLQSSTVDGIIADSFSISGGYITVQTLEERDILNVGPLVNGQPVYVTDEDKSYRWDGTSWVEETLKGDFYSHVQNKENPHEVTKDQLGLDQVDNTSDIDKPISSAVQGALDQLNSQTVKNIGDQEIKGSLTLVKEEGENGFTGNLTIQGNLVVSGTTITTEQETIRTPDNLIVLNSDGIDLGTSLSGIAIRTSEADSYGIVYDATTNSVSLGKGIIDESNGFIFNEGEGNPLALRDQAANFADGDLITWNSTGNKFVSGGTLQSLGVAFQDEVDKIKEDIEAQSNSISDINITLGQAQEAIDANAQEIQYVKESIGTLDNLPTENKTVEGSIKEIYNKLGVDTTAGAERLAAHIESTNNPHEVTIDQLITTNTAFNVNFETAVSNIKMDGVGSVGSLNTVARADHIHPSDTGRAPKNHRSTTNLYGLGDSNYYGHVKVDDTISDTSVNPIQNKIVKSYIDNHISGLTGVYNPIIEDYSNTGSTSKTVGAITQTNGRVEVSYADIEIPMGKVQNLDSTLSNLNLRINSEVQSSKDRDALLSQSIDAEADARATADASNLSQMQSDLNTSLTELKSNYNLDILKNLPTDTTKKYLLAYDSTNSKWDWSVVNTETWEFTDENDTIVTKQLYLGASILKINGTWIIGNNPAPINTSEALEVLIRFTSNGNIFAGIVSYPDGNLYYRSIGGQNTLVYNGNTKIWPDPAYRTVLFKNANTNNNIIYTWLKDNSTKQVS